MIKIKLNQYPVIRMLIVKDLWTRYKIKNIIKIKDIPNFT
jgi:hypothetical protein